MPDYEHIADVLERISGETRQNLGVYECSKCGALVTRLGQLQHTTWHSNMRRVAEDASWGGMLRPLG